MRSHDRTASSAERDDWLGLLTAGVSVQALVAHRDLLKANGVEPAVAEHQLKDAVALRDLLDQRRRKAAELAALNAIAGRLASVTDVDRLLHEIVEQAKNLLQVDLAYLSLITDDRITIEVAIGQISGYLTGLTMPVAEGFSSAVLTKAAPLWTSDYRNDSRFAHHGLADKAAKLEDIRGLLGVPMVVRGQTIGVLFAAKRQERTFVADEIELLNSLASHAAVALDNSRVLSELRSSTTMLRSANDQLEAILGWDRFLTQVVLRGADAEDLLAEVGQKAGCPVLFLRSPADLPAELQAIDAGVVSEIFDRSTESDASAELDAGTLTVRTMPVVASGDVLGVLMLARRSQDARPDHAMILERAAPSMALLLVGQRAAEEAARKTREGLLIDLLTRPTTDRRETMTQARLVGVDPNRGYTVVVMLPTHDKARVRRGVDALGLPPGSVTGDYGQRVVALIPVADADEVARTWFDSANIDATVGISASTSDVTRLRGRFRDAVQTVDVMLTLDRQGQVGTAERLGLYRILLSQGGPHEVDRLYEQHLGAVRAEEERSGVPLLATLEAFLHNSQRHAATAAVLNVHSNTLYQRLDKLTKILGPRWRDPDQALDLQLVVRLKRSVSRLGDV
ncbi:MULTISPECIES: GAF domain-containing protein [unclassified Mycolicibacterium]|uniref:helix-turn-helix domain-containing protein n=1 Tax=unclassified Mycolicibacterium TaxID=2636767 RepID=UPI0012DBFAFA|nr:MULTISPECIES: GAF domain-containing protein [unclassified Mycolicibacterium]MUL84757.1 GAF domain-containing protein [Mycolicibacterium sp. CBMA 329]MUL88532.1 GAF domain-containing protein [Mycolicibacterium sp. CBMA 331]MUM00129.1 GAF domain-containing protein [Mycolicibacterium sp. CBMA 334]MUM27794.1 GAF domain-containing protein [Mycolicibacterium sp. CBMA 295]MUM40179.1 GAF domain-containing protein [Mycolicibacterium sp. CBMA 247]